MIVECPKCQKKYDLDKSHLAKGAVKVRCPNCKQVWVVGLEQKRPGLKVPAALPRQPESQEQVRSAASEAPKLLPLEDLVTVRLIVGFLGEKPQFGWWNTDFLSDTGQQFLPTIFPRSAFSAGFTSMSEAAKLLHDSHIGHGRVYHLFRLPEFIEQKIHRRLLELEPSGLSSWIASKEQALKKLDSVSDGSFKEAEGPIQLGGAKDFWQLSAIKLLAKSYNQAFTGGKKIFPYFTD